VTLISYGSHLLLLWWVVSWLLLFAQIGRNIFFAFSQDRRTQTLWLAVLICIYTYIYLENRSQDALAYLTLLWTILGTLACWVRHTTLVRSLFFISTIPWAFYVLEVGSIFPIILQATFSAGIFINILRFDILALYKLWKWKKL